MKLQKKVDYLFEVKSTYTYRIFENYQHQMTIKVQKTEDFKNDSDSNFALVTTSKENFEKCITVEYLNKLLLDMRKSIRPNGRWGVIECNYLPVWEDVSPDEYQRIDEES